jgi:predicted CDP-diglyceride synthetase/phosphatidate cytidylyltransferase
MRRYIMNTLQNRSSGASGGRRNSLKRILQVRFKLVLCIVLLILAIGNQKIFGQGVGISEVSIVPDGTSILELRSTLRGFLAPRMTTAARLAIASPAQGLLVYDTSVKSFWYYDSGWKALPSSSVGWGTANQLLGMNSTADANEYKTLSGSVNITIANAAGSIALNTIQDITTTSSPTFAGLILTSPLAVIYGGTGLQSGLSGGIPYFSTNTTVASSALLTANGVVVGGGAGIAPYTIIPGTNNTVLRGSTGGAPSFGQIQNGDIANGTIDLTTKVTGLLPLNHGGTNSDLSGSVAVGDLLTGTAIGFSRLADIATGNVLISGGIGAAPSWGKVGLTSHVSGVLPITNGGTNSGAALSGSSIIVSDGVSIIQGAKGTTTTVLHGDAGGVPTYGQVVTADIANDAITTIKILDGNVTTTKLADNAVTTIKISDANVTVSKLGTSGVPDANRVYTTNATGVPTLIPISTFTYSNLLNGEIYIGDALNTAVGRTMSGDATISNLGVLLISNDAITSAKILDGTIVNADVDGAAAIAGTKINPNFGIQNVSTTGGVTAGSFTGPLTGNVTGNLLGDVTGNVTGNITGNAGTATKLSPGNTINGVLFDGSSAIVITAAAGTLTGNTLNAGVLNSSLTSVGTLGTLAVTGGVTAGSFTGPLTGNVTGNLTGNVTGNLTGDITGNAGTATKLSPGNTINGVNFDGSIPITVTAAAGTLTGNTLNAGVLNSSLTSVGTLGSLAVTGAVTAGSFTGPLTGNVTGNLLGDVTGNVTGNITGNAATATKLSPGNTINGVNFDGSAPITVTAAAGTLTGTTLNPTVVTSSLTSVGTLANLTVIAPIVGSVTGTSSNVTGTVAIGNGGTGQTTRQTAINALAGGVTTGQYLRGDGINVSLSAIQAGDVPLLNQSTTGNAATATKLSPGNTINGVNFDGSTPITITAAAGTLTGNTLNH